MGISTLQTILYDHFRAFLFNTGIKKPKSALETAEFKYLAKKGLIKKYVVDSLQILYTAGKASAILGDSVVRNFGKAKVTKMINAGEIMLSNTEKASLELVRAEIENKLEGLFSDVKAEINGAYRNRVSGDESFRASVRGALVDKVAGRKSIKQLANDIGKRTGAWGRDLHRIAFTESVNLYEYGTVLGHMAKTNKKADEVFVAKIPRAGACKECVRLFTNKDGTPKVFKLSDIIGNSNVGRKRKDWLPTIGPVHPFCGDRTIIVFEGQQYNKEKKRFEYAK